MSNLIDLIYGVLNEMGFIILDEGEDFLISDYIVDSIQFISFIVNLEKKLDVNLSDDFLSYNNLGSVRGFANKLQVYLDEIL